MHMISNATVIFVFISTESLRELLSTQLLHMQEGRRDRRLFTVSSIISRLLWVLTLKLELLNCSGAE